MKRYTTDASGTVTIFVIISLAFFLVMGGIAIDLAYFTAVRGELQRSVDAAALAGAGNLGFGAYAFDAAQTAAQTYAGLNPYRGGAVALTPANITTGVYSGATGTFTPLLDGSQVNAVRCNFATAIPTSFLSLLGLATLPVAANAIAVASPPLTPPPGTCVFPLGLSQCSFQNAADFNTNGCGASITFKRRFGIATASKNAAWVNLAGPETPTPENTDTAITNVANGGGCPAAPSVGAEIGTTSVVWEDLTEWSDVFSTLATTFSAERSSGITVKDNEGNTTYSGSGWVVYIPVIETACPSSPAAFGGARELLGWTRLVISDVKNAAPGNWYEISGYVDCKYFDAPYNPNPAPISALSRRPRLVQ